jgi:hypothetical protein
MNVFYLIKILKHQNVVLALWDTLNKIIHVLNAQIYAPSAFYSPNTIVGIIKIIIKFFFQNDLKYKGNIFFIVQIEMTIKSSINFLHYLEKIISLYK